MNKGLIDEAIVNYSKAIELNTRQELAYMLRGNCYTERGMFIQASNDYKKAVALNPELAKLYTATDPLTAALSNPTIGRAFANTILAVMGAYF